MRAWEDPVGRTISVKGTNHTLSRREPVTTHAGHAGMQACRHAGMQACRHAGMQTHHIEDVAAFSRIGLRDLVPDVPHHLIRRRYVRTHFRQEQLVAAHDVGGRLLGVCTDVGAVQHLVEDKTGALALRPRPLVKSQMHVISEALVEAETPERHHAEHQHAVAADLFFEGVEDTVNAALHMGFYVVPDSWYRL